MWSILEEVSINEDYMEVLKKIYKDNQVQITWEGRTSRQPIDIHKRLKQGCPLSQLLFMFYVPGIERVLEYSKLCFDLSYSHGGQVVEQRIPVLIDADDTMLLAGNAVDLQRLADICGEETTRLGLSFTQQSQG